MFSPISTSLRWKAARRPNRTCIERQQWQHLWYHIDRLPARHARAVRLSYGIGCEPHNLEQVGNQLNVCRERARQIIAKGERLLRDRMLRKEDPKRWRELQAQENAKARARQQPIMN